ncbi:MAG: YfjI family protein [Longimicrobiales bacterium]
MPDALPLDALPPMFRAHVASVAANLQVPTDLPIILGLGTLSAALAGRVETDVRSGWREPVNIYTAAILPPACRKSPAYAMMTHALRDHEAESVLRATPRFLAALDVVDVAERKLERTKADVVRGKAEPSEVEAARADLLAARAKVPPDGRLLAGDITAEAMVLRMAAQGGRLAILEPEPGPLQLLAGRYSDSARLDELKKAWSGEALTVDRVGRAPVHVERPALTLALCLQPGVLARLENREAFRGEGVLARFLWVEPSHGLGQRRTGRDVPPVDRQAERAFVRIVRMLADLPPVVDAAGIERPNLLSLDADALDLLEAFEAEIEPQLADGARCEPVRDWAGKCVGQAVRVAAILELATRAEDSRPLIGEPIREWAMASAVRMMRALLTHALAVLGPIDSRGRLLLHVLNRAAGLPPGTTLRDLFERTKGCAAIESMDDLRSLLEELVDRGCLRVQERPSTGGRPPSPLLQVHPALRDSLRTSRTSSSEDEEAETSATSANRLAEAPSSVTDPWSEVDELLRVEVPCD